MIGNILSLALGAIGGRQAIMLSPFQSRTTNAAGYQDVVYGPATAIEGNAQPVERKLYQKLGLNFEKSYVTLFTSATVRCVGRDCSGDKITYQGANYICESSTPWNAQAGWAEVIAVQVP